MKVQCLKSIVFLFCALLFTIVSATDDAMGETKKWQPVVLTFESGSYYKWNTFPLQVSFANGSKYITVDGYWDGGNTWKVGFAPPESGVWNWSSSSTDDQMNGQTGNIVVTEPSETDVSNNPNYRGHIQADGSNRFFQYNDGTPFFWLGDTNWLIMSDRCGIENGNFYTYLNDRLEKQFTLIQVQYIAARSVNEGGAPITSLPDSWSDLNYEYFQWVDLRIHEIWNNGLVVAGHPTWFSEFAISLEEAKNLSRYLWARYGAYNIIWSLSGEYSTSFENKRNEFTREDWEEIGKYLASLNGHEHPLSVHPRGFVSSNPIISHSSSHEFHDSAWLDHNWIQSFNFIEELIPQIYADYNRMPIKPVVLSEGAYEGVYPEDNGPVMNYEFVDAYLARYQAWSSFLNGAAGHTYGAGGVWRMYDPSFADPGTHGNHTKPWYEDLQLEASFEMQHIRSFFSSLEWNSLEPMRSWLLVNGEPAPFPEASDFSSPSASGKFENTYVIYIPRGNGDKAIEIQNLGDEEYFAQWFNPRNAQYSEIAFAPSFVSAWIVPERPDSDDWVVLLKAKSSLQQDTLSPKIDEIPDGFAIEGVAYFGKKPALLQGEDSVIWTLANGPKGMTMDSANGAVEWSNPVSDGSPFTVTIVAANPYGSDEKSWRLNVEPGTLVIVDNSDSGFSTDGVWTKSSYISGYRGADYRYAPAGAGSKRATWTLPVVTGQYQLYANWPVHENRASNVEYRVYNNGQEIGTQIFDQRINGGRFNVFDTPYLIEAGTIEVVLSDYADGYVIADAVQAVYQSPGENLPPNGVTDTPSSDVTVTVGSTVEVSGTGSDPDNNFP